MVKTITELLAMHSLKEAELLNPESDLNLWVRTVTTDLTDEKCGTVYILSSITGLDYALFMKNHPNAAGFIVDKKLSVKGEVPVILSLDGAACEEEWNGRCTSDPVMDLYTEVLSRKDRTAETILHRIAGLSRTSLILFKEDEPDIIAGSEPLDEADYRTLKSTGTLMKDGQQYTAGCTEILLPRKAAVLMSVRKGERRDDWALECCGLAFRGAMISASYDHSAAERFITDLIVLGHYRMIQEFGRRNRIAVPENADIFLLYSRNHASLTPWMSSIRDFCSSFGRVCLMEQIGGDILIVQEEPSSNRERIREIQSLGEYCSTNRIPTVLVGGIRLSESCVEIRHLQKMMGDVMADAFRIFPERHGFLLSELLFAENCRRVIMQGGREQQRARSIIDRLGVNRGEYELADTLSVYLIDENMSITETSGRLFVHRNTIKYRVQKAEDLLGMDLGNMTELRDLILALGIFRLLRQPTAAR